MTSSNGNTVDPSTPQSTRSASKGAVTPGGAPSTPQEVKTMEQAFQILFESAVSQLRTIVEDAIDSQCPELVTLLKEQGEER